MKYALVFLALLLVACSGASEMEHIDEVPHDDEEMHDMEESMPQEPIEEVIENDSPAEDTVAPEPDVTFVLTGENFVFFEEGVESPELHVNVGDVVRIEFSSTQGFHDWVVDEFDAATAKVRDGEGMTFVTFVADTAGTFEYYCSVGSHRANGMVGNLIVEE